MKKELITPLIALLFIACSNYGDKEKSGSIEVFYKEGISKEQAKKTADLIYESLKSANQDINTKKSFQYTKGKGDTINLSMVIDEGKIAQVNDEAMNEFSVVISDSIFAAKPVNLVLTDNRFKPIRTIVFKKPEISENTPNLVSGNINLTYSEKTEPVLAKNLADYLNSYLPFEGEVRFYFTKNATNTFVIKMVTKAEAINTLSPNDIEEIASNISTNVFQGAPLIYELADEKFNTIRSFPYPAQ